MSSRSSSQPPSAPTGESTRLSDRHVVRWYVLTLPICHKGPAVGLQTELQSRERAGEPLFEYFAPTFVKSRTLHGKTYHSPSPLLYNYVFIRASEVEILRLKRHLPQYNFLPRIRDSRHSYYPYISDAAMQNLQWVAAAYSDRLPVYLPDPLQLVKGDRVRITEGQFAGIEATMVHHVGDSQGAIVVCIEQWMCIPLLHVQRGQYEVISLNAGSKRLYACLDNDRLAKSLHEALRRHHSAAGVTAVDRAVAADALRQFGHLQVDSDIMRGKLYAYLLVSYTILGDTERRDRVVGTILSLLPVMKAEQSRALLYCALYGCTDNHLYHREAHRLIDPWRTESQLKKYKRTLIGRLDDYDCWFGH